MMTLRGRHRIYPTRGSRLPSDRIWLEFEMTRWVFAIILVMTLGVAAAFSPREGSEVLIVDPSGQNILGHGRIVDGRLELSLSADTTDFKLLLVQADGSIEAYEGRREGLHRLDIEIEPGQRVSLSELLAEANFHVSVTLASATPNQNNADALSGADDRPEESESEPGEDAGLPLPPLPSTPPGTPTVTPPVAPPVPGVPGRGDRDDDDDDEGSDDERDDGDGDDDRDDDDDDEGDDDDGLLPLPPIDPVDPTGLTGSPR